MSSNESAKGIVDLCEDVHFKSKVDELDKRIDTLGDVIKSCCNERLLTNLNSEDKVRYDLFLSYSLTSLYWVYLRTQGEEPAGHIRSELDRIKKYIDKAKLIRDRKSMPKLDRCAAKRFVRSGLWDPNQLNKEDNATMRKKRKHIFQDNE